MNYQGAKRQKNFWEIHGGLLTSCDNITTYAKFKILCNLNLHVTVVTDVLERNLSINLFMRRPLPGCITVEYSRP